nr:hypothetical protein [Streptomyces scabichelini]
MSGKLAERWSALLSLPGLMFLVVAATAFVLDHSRWNDVGRLRLLLDDVAASPAAHSAGAIGLVAGAVLTGAAGVGLAAEALGTGLEQLWLMDARGPLTRRLAAHRLRRWQQADAAFRAALVEAGRARLAGGDTTALVEDAARLNATRNRVAIAPPRHPFWTGDRISATNWRVWNAYRLDLSYGWPRLWLMVEDAVRAELNAARLALASAARLSAWGAGYLVLGVWWWPAGAVGLITLATGVRRGRAAAVTLAELVESTVDLYMGKLASELGIECSGSPTRVEGMAVTRALRKGA